MKYDSAKRSVPVLSAVFIKVVVVRSVANVVVEPDCPVGLFVMFVVELESVIAGGALESVVENEAAPVFIVMLTVGVFEAAVGVFEAVVSVLGAVVSGLETVVGVFMFVVGVSEANVVVSEAVVGVFEILAVVSELADEVFRGFTVFMITS
jgi:hypothetical protein